MFLRYLPLCSVLLIFAAPARADDAATAFFENQVRPLLVKSCLHCHGPKKQSSSLRLDSREAILRGGDRGPAIVPGDPKKSLLIQAIGHQNDLRMPKQKLGDDQIAILTQWIRMGAPWPDEIHAPAAIRSGAITDKDRQFWSYQPIRKPSLPEVKDTAWPKTDVDRFILARLEEKRLKPAPLADKRTLLRRVTFDLI